MFKSIPSSSGSSINEHSCHVCIFLSFSFHKSTWLQGTIESNTRAEMLSIYELWLDCANDYIRRSMDKKHSSSQSLVYSNSMNQFPVSNQLSASALQLQTSATSLAITGTVDFAILKGSHFNLPSHSSKAPSLAHSVSESGLGLSDSNERNYVSQTSENLLKVEIFIFTFLNCCLPVRSWITSLELRRWIRELCVSV